MALARAKPGHLTFGSSGVGSPFHLAGEMFKVMAGVDMLHVPYKGSGPVLQALLSGELMSAFASLGPVLPHIRAGKLRALGIVDTRRTDLLPNVPTIAEAAPLPGYGMDSWLGLVMPAGTPKAIVERVNAELVRVVRDPKFAEEKLKSQSYDPVGSTPAQMTQVMTSDLAKYAKLVRDARIPSE
jgi:tripartite-type tricarboxylate transporter receptor subunit TctC